MSEGLTDSEVKQRLAQFGYNELVSAQPKSIGHIAFEVMKEPMFILLISCGILYMIVGDYKEGGILLCSIFIIIFSTFYQYQKTEKALESLKKMASPRALVIRNGSELRISGKEVVPGDIILLHEGDRVCADAELFTAINLSIDESLLTGESAPVLKDAAEGGTLANKKIYSGSLVVQGKGKAKVLYTGSQTELGTIGTSLNTIVQNETQLQQEMKKLIRNLFIFGAIISVAVVVAFYFTRGNFVQSLLNGLSASMAILPEEFPVVLTIFMALGAWRLSKKNVLTRNPSAIETLGSATVLCTDKTGTITQNKMEIVCIYNIDTWIAIDTFDISQHVIKEIVLLAQLASQKASIDPMEKAIEELYLKYHDIEISSYKLIKEYALSKELLSMTRVMESQAGEAKIIATKGAPEAIFALCKMSKDEVLKQLERVKQMAEKGYRVIAVAQGINTIDMLPESQLEFEYIYKGLLGFEDPIRKEVPQAIEECTQAGIRVIMITGDYPATAQSIAQQIGLPTNGLTITGDQLNQMSDEELKTKIAEVTIFARVVPDQKLRIVEALKSRNEVVAMTGDGVNDAPALKAAHIGIAMGNKGTDVAREASSLILLDDNFASIVGAIRLGRRIFDNLQKAMSYVMAIHIPIIGLTLMPAFLSWLPLLLMPLHIVFMELIIDPVCSIAFESEQEEEGVMTRPPRKYNATFFGFKQIMSSVLQGLLLFAMVLVVYFLSIKEGHSDGAVRAIAFTALIIGNIVLIFNNLSRTRSFMAVIKEGNNAVLIILTIALVVLFLIISVPVVRELFSFESPGGYMHFVISLAGAASVLTILEILKYINNRKKRATNLS